MTDCFTRAEGGRGAWARGGTANVSLTNPKWGGTRACQVLRQPFSGLVCPVEPSGGTVPPGRLMTLTVWEQVLSALPDGASEHGALPVGQITQGTDV